jgi:hypothetical protein
MKGSCKAAYNRRRCSVIIFATIFGVGFFLLISSLFFGHEGEYDVSGGTDLDAHGDVGHGPSIFSMRMVALLMVGFGSLSFGVRATTDASMFVSSMAGVGGGLIVSAVGYFIIRLFYASQASSTITDDDIIGSAANVIDAISEGGQGQVACVVRGREITYLARSKDGKPIDRGAPVKIVVKSGGIVTVEPLE